MSLKELFNAIGSSFRDLGNSLQEGIFGDDQKGNYTASWGSHSGVLDSASSSTGFAITSGKFLSVEDSFEHVLCCGGSGSGKSVNTTIVGVLEQREASMVVLDNSGEMYDLTAAAKVKDGYTVITLDLSPGIITEDTPCYNPLHRLKLDDAEGIAKLTKLLVSQSSEKRDFWSIKSEDVVYLAIWILLHRPKEERTLFNLHVLIETMAGDQDKVSEYVVGLGEDVFRKWEVLLNNSEKTLDSIRSSALAATTFITFSKALQKVTRQDSIDFDQLRKEKVIIYLKTPIDDSVVKPVISMFFTQLFNHFLSKPRPKEKMRPILIYAEEFGSTYIPGFDKIISNCRKWQIGCQMVVQSFEQLTKIYGREGLAIIKSNCAKLIFSGVEEAEEISRILGKVTHTDLKTNYKRDRELMSASEIRSMDNSKAIFLPRKGKPLLVNLRPYYRVRRLVKKTKMAMEHHGESTVLADVILHPLTLPSYGKI